MGTHWPDGGYSADITLTLYLDDGTTIPCGGVAHNDLRLSQPSSAAVPPGMAGRFVMTVDGRPREWRVKLPSGICQGDMHVAMEDAAAN